MTTSEIERYRAWALSFRRRLGPEVDRDLLVAVARTAAQVVQLPPVTVTDAARALGIPGKTPAAKAQKLRRLEREGTLPPAHRSLMHGDRFWFREELAELIATREVA